MGASFGMTFVGIVVIGIVLNVLRFVLMANAVRGGGRKVARIADMDSHLSFDERIAERMRELDRDKALSTPVERAPMASAPPLAARDPASPVRPSFGRRAS